MTKINENYEEPDFEDVIDLIDDGTFQIGQGYQNKAAEKYTCKKCGGDNFKVGNGSYYTAIKCVKCEWEMCVHEG